jgi:hypothetical protein
VLQEGGDKYRVKALKGYGNSIVPQVAAVFIGAVMEWLETQSGGDSC